MRRRDHAGRPRLPANPKKRIRVKIKMPMKTKRMLQRKVAQLQKLANPKKVSLSDLVSYALETARLDRLTLRELDQRRRRRSE